MNKPVNAVIFQARILNLLTTIKTEFYLKTELNYFNKRLKKAKKSLVDREHETLQILGKTAEYKDPETASHVARVAKYSKLLAREYGLSQKRARYNFLCSTFS